MYNLYPSYGIQYVNGYESAERFQMGPNQQTILMDSDEPVFYLKTTDAAGVAKVKEFEFKERVHMNPDQLEIKELKDKIAKLEFLIKSMKGAEYESDTSTESESDAATV